MRSIVCTARSTRRSAAGRAAVATWATSTRRYAVNLLIAECWEWLTALFDVVPGRAGRLLRRWLYRASFAHAGTVLSIDRRVEVRCPRNISVGNHIHLSAGVVLRACDDAQIAIGDFFGANGNARLIADK